ncbi:MAG TPA: ATP-binding protein [bacterium]|nr:ATP-binding protein [bacterium]HPP87719.1 ATP-binding protein [bacterium]
MDITGKNILIYSPTNSLLNFISSYILQNNAIPFATSTISEAINILMNECIDLVILGIENYADERSYETEFGLLKIINTNFLYMPTIVIMREFNQDVLKKILKNGIVAFFVQPFEIEELGLEIQKIKLWRGSILNRLKIANTSTLNYRVSIESDENYVGAVSNNIADIILAIRPNVREEINSIVLAINEMLMNAILHGNKRDKNKKVDINFFIDSEKVTIIITDEGAGFDYNNLPDPTEAEYILRDSGRGIFLTKMYIDKVNYYLNGRRIELIKYLKK